LTSGAERQQHIDLGPIVSAEDGRRRRLEDRPIDRGAQLLMGRQQNAQPGGVGLAHSGLESCHLPQSREAEYRSGRRPGQ
jgi:hypothetical protein